MRGTIVKLMAAAVLLVAFSVTCLYVGNRKASAAAAVVQRPENPLAQQFASDPGDGWTLAGGFLLLVGLAVTGAGGMLWLREEKQ